MKNKKLWLVITLIVLTIGGCFGDRIISEMVFSYQCKKNSGVFIYEEVALDESYVIPIPKDYRKRDSWYELTERKMIDKEKLELNYKVVHEKYEKIFSLGPVLSLNSNIYRKKDNKKISEVITFVNGNGWIFKRLNKIFIGRGGFCPSGVDLRGVSRDVNLHYNLIRSTFYLNAQKGS